MTRVAIVGAGVAGAMLALRLAEQKVPVDLFAGTRAKDADATGVSGGMVRGFEPDPAAASVAAAGVAELRSDVRMREWSGYREIGSAYVTAVGEPPSSDALDAVHERLPGSLRVADPAELPLRGVPDGAVAVIEQHAGFISPARLRASVLAELPGMGVTVHTRQVTAVAGGEVRTGTQGFDGYSAVVVAAGAWTRELTSGQFTTRQIQFSLYPVTVPGLTSFVDDTSGLYGRPYGDRTLFALSSERWGLRPDEITPDAALTERVTACVADRLGLTTEPERTVASFDCYVRPAGLRLREAGDVLTFTGGSGGAAKSVVAASRAAARELVPVLEGAT